MKHGAESNRNVRDAGSADSCRQLHLIFGWWSLLAFLTFGLVLEAFHGFKLDFYLDLNNETRRLLWTLAHAHGTLLSLINIAFAVSIGLLPGWTAGRLLLASRTLLASTLLLPFGFLLGGAVIYHGDPGPGVVLVPIGALLLMVAVFVTARAASVRRATRAAHGDSDHSSDRTLNRRCPT